MKNQVIFIKKLLTAAACILNKAVNLSVFVIHYFIKKGCPAVGTAFFQTNY